MNIKGCTSLLIAICTVTLLAACDIGPSGLRSGFDRAADDIEPTPQGITITITGAAAKGPLYNGIVNIHPIVEGVLSDTSVVSNVRTSAVGGTYNVTIPSYDGNPFLVSIRADDQTRMRCDLSGGCGDGVSFGGFASITDTSFRLDAISPPVTSSNTTMNVTLLTHAAAKASLQNMMAATDKTLANVVRAITDANSSLGNRIGVTGSLTSLPVVDLTVPADLMNVSQNVLQYNLINAAIVDSLVNGGANQTIAQSVRSFATQYAGGGIADTETVLNTANITLEKILNRASAIIDSIRTVDTANTLNLNNLQTTVNAKRQLAANGSIVPTQGTPTDLSLTDLQKVKAMVAELRKVGTAIEAGFEDEQGMIDEALDDDAGVVLSAFSSGVEALGAAWLAYEDNDTITSYLHVATGITVAITNAEGEVTYAIDGDITVDETAVELMLTALDDGSSYSNTEGDNSEAAAATIDLDISGSAESSKVVLTLNTGALSLSATASSTETSTQTGSTEAVAAMLSGFVADLKLNLMETSAASNDPVTFAGSFKISVSNLSADEDITNTQSINQQQMVSFMSSMTSELSADAVSVSLGGKFSTMSGASMTASVVVSADGTDFSVSCNEDDVNSSCTEENEQNYVGLNFTTAFVLSSLGDISVPTTVTISGNRSSLEDALLDVSVSYGAVTLNTSYDTGNDDSDTSTLVITDQNLVTLTITETEDSNGDTDVSGNITLNNVEHATISDGTGIVVVSYSDSFNESLW